MEYGNSNNLGPATVNALLGAVVGEKVGSVLIETITTTDLLGFSDEVPTLGYDVAVEIGAMFEGPARSPQELLERISTLIPDPTQETEQETLIEKFKRHDMFKKQTDDVTVKCPAVHQTGVIFDEWGRRLAKDEVYRRKFLSLVTLGDDKFVLKYEPQVNARNRNGKKGKKRR